MKKVDLTSKTKSELLKMAQRLGLRGISTLNKSALVERVQQAQEAREARESKRPTGISAAAKRVAEAVKRRAIRRREQPEALKAPAPRKSPLTRVAKPEAKPSKTPLIEQPAEAPVAEELSAHKFEVGKSSPKQVLVEDHLGELPEAYGTGRLFLSARDPNWLYAYWDLTWQQMADYRGQSSDGRLLLRVYEKNHPNPVQELTLHHDTHNWYIPVNKPATSYVAELGIWNRQGNFQVISRSREATTPSATVSSDTSAHFATIPVDISFRELLGIVQGHMRQGETLAHALHRLQREGFKFPFKVEIDLGSWSTEQAAALESILGGDILRRVQMGSFEISEWLRRRLQEQLGSAVFSAFSPGGASWSGPAPKGFWFVVNAELIVYGATEPGAKVTVDGKPIELRSDGTFSFHFAFPDGTYRMPVVAVSPSGDDKRQVDLKFERESKTRGTVGSAPQAPHLRAPKVA